MTDGRTDGRTDGQTDRQTETDGGRCNISRPGPLAPREIKMCIFGYSGGPGRPINNRTGPILLPRHPLTYINLHIKYGSNPISYRENDEMSVDAAAADAA